MDICLKIKDYFSSLPEKAAFESAYRLAALLHEAASTDGYKNRVPWKEKDYSVDEVSSWGLSVCSEPEGSTVRKNNSIFFALGNGYIPPNGAQMRDLKITMEQFSNLTVLKVLYALYGLTLSDFDLYVTADELASAAHLKVEDGLWKGFPGRYTRNDCTEPGTAYGNRPEQVHFCPPSNFRE